MQFVGGCLGASKKYAEGSSSTELGGHELGGRHEPLWRILQLVRMGPSQSLASSSFSKGLIDLRLENFRGRTKSFYSAA